MLHILEFKETIDHDVKELYVPKQVINLDINKQVGALDLEQ